MILKYLCVAAAAITTASSAMAQTETSNIVDTTTLRVCADPANMPFSNMAGEGFENKIAELVAAELKIPVAYTWFPMATGFVRQTLRAGRCDIIIGFAQGDELVQNTNHYYRSAWVIVYKTGSGLDGLVNLNDERLQGKKLGIIAGAPPGDVLAVNGLIGNARPYALMVDRRYESPSEQMVKDIESGAIDAGILWGPIGGYYAKKSATPMTVTPLVKETKGARQAYRITFGVRPHDQEWKRDLNRLITRKQNDIHKILLDYGVPLLDENDQLITK
ncbi:MAG: substrate-binding domain-containing protein [Hyphomicrobiales bacterium]|nr:substrate-binding domain-containing protein [Hyphomicrobiales bacterium]